MNTCVYVLLSRYLWVQNYSIISVPARNNPCPGIQFTCHTDNIIIISHRNHRKHRNGLRPAMRHDYPHAETQRAQRSRRDFIVPLAHSAPHPLRGGVLARGGGVLRLLPHPSYAHPSPTMGGELITTGFSRMAFL